MRRFRLALAIPVVMLGTLTACGSDADDSATETTAASTTEASVETTDAPDTTDASETTEVSETTAADGTESASSDLCVPLKKLSDFDQESATIIAGGDWAAIQQFFVASTPSVLDAYDEAIALDSDLTEALTTLRGITDGTSELAAESTDLMDFAGRLTALPGIIEAGQDGFELNEFAQSTCGFSTGGATA